MNSYTYGLIFASRNVWDVKSTVIAGDNSLRVAFQSPVEFARRRAEEVTTELGYSVPPSCVPEEYNGECHANHIRKMQVETINFIVTKLFLSIYEFLLRQVFIFNQNIKSI